MIRQLAFDLPPIAALARSDFIVSASNAQALAAIDGWHGWPGQKMLLTGPAGAGKTHLAHIWAAEAGAAVIGAAALAAADLLALTDGRPVAVLGCDAIGGDTAAEEALFHLHNLCSQHATGLLLTARTPPRDWGLRLPDLTSRVQAMAQTRLAAPDDGLLSAVLVKLLADRQISVPPALIPFLISRMERSLDAARVLVAALDAEALALRKPISRTLAATVLDKVPGGGE